MASPDADIVGNSQNRKHPPLSALVDLDREREKLARLCNPLHPQHLVFRARLSADGNADHG